jgi:NSS family neurotransmitter:Na+ symporter
MAAESPLLEEQRENWGSRAGFILAAIGSAVGLGNLWGFPYKLYSYGGGAFLIPYIAAMLIIGVPILILEFSLGHMTQRAAPEAFRRTGRAKQPVGWWGILLGFVIITYYPVILAWCLSFLGRSVEGIVYHGGSLYWADSAGAAQEFFLFRYANMWTGSEGHPGWFLGTINPEIALCLAGVWLLMFLCIFRGVNVVSKVVLWTVPLPWLMLLILMFRGLTLDGASEGLAYYLNPNFGELLEPTTWRYAFGQVFFSMSLAFGVMLTYASFLHRKSDINNNALVIGLGDLGTSFVAGIAIFATLGAMSLETTTPVPEVIGEGTFGMAFIAFPYALAQLPYSAWFALVFFFALITLGIDSAFSITESILASIVDKTGWNRTAVLWGITFFGLATGLVYCSRGGLAWLKSIDGFVNGPWGIALLGMLECVVLGWMFRLSRLREHANERSDWKLGIWWDWNIRLFVPVVLSALFVWSLYDTLTAEGGFLVSSSGEANVPNIVGLALAGLAPILAVLLSLRNSRAENIRQPKLLDAKPDGETDTRHSRLAFGAACVALVLAGAACVLLVQSQRKLTAYKGEQMPLARAEANRIRAAAMVGVEAGAPNASERAEIADAQAEAFLTERTKQIQADAVDAGLAMGISERVYWGGLVVTAVLAVGGVVSGCIHTLVAEKRRLKPHWTGQGSGALGTVTLGASIGLSLALLTMLGKVSAGTPTHKSELTGGAYITMVVMLGILVIGLGWCFYKAMTAARGEEEEEQLSEM